MKIDNFLYSQMQGKYQSNNGVLRDLTHSTAKKRGIYTVGFIPWDFIEKPWDCWVLFFGTPPKINYGNWVTILLR